MTPTDDWSGWTTDWQQQPVVDVERLQRRLHRKMLRMRAMVAFEILVGLFAAAQLGRLLVMPGVDTRWRIWVGLAFMLVAVVGFLQIHLRRGSWRAVTANIPDLLRLTARRARIDIRLAWVNVVGFLLLVVVTIVVAAPWLMPARWLGDPALQRVLLLQTGVAGGVTVVAFVVLAFFIRCQQRHLHQVEALLRDYQD